MTAGGNRTWNTIAGGGETTVAPGVGLEPTTYGLTVPEKSSRAVHLRPPRPSVDWPIPLPSSVGHQRPWARLSDWLSALQG